MCIRDSYQVEANHTITGAAADDRATCKPSQMGAIAVALYNAVTNGAPPSLSSKKLNQLVTKAAADLKKGNGLVVCGVNDVNIQTVVNAIDAAKEMCIRDRYTTRRLLLQAATSMQMTCTINGIKHR